jgi:hypothetical protein
MEREWHSTDLEIVEASAGTWYRVKVRHIPTGLVAEAEGEGRIRPRMEAINLLKRKLEARASVGMGAVSDPIPDRFKPVKWRP